jgi:SAM-dependent methyltransferase
MIVLQGGKLKIVGLLPDYSRQALAYDSTRAASPSVLSPLRRALDGAPGRRLLDIGGGTGNYALALAHEGWAATVLDRSPQMLDQAHAKGLPAVPGEAEQLPFAAESFDAAMLVSMLHHVDSPERALDEARRVLVPGGRLALMVFTREDIADTWCTEYFPSSRPWMEANHLRLAELLAMLPGAEHLPVHYEDVEDGSLAALMGRPELVLDPRQRTQTSYFERMERGHPEELRAGLERLRREIAAGDGPDRCGRATVIAWRKPAS